MALRIKPLPPIPANIGVAAKTFTDKDKGTAVSAAVSPSDRLGQRVDPIGRQGLFGHRETAKEQLIKTIAERTDKYPLDITVPVLRFSVVMFFVRGDRAGDGEKIANIARASFEYWNRDSGDHLDVIFPGWYQMASQSEGSSAINFDIARFLNYRDEIQAKSKWKYTGETDILLLNFDFNVARRTGDFSFQEVIILPVEAMIRKSLIGSLDGLMSEIIRIARESKWEAGGSAVWVLSDKIGYMCGRKAFWDAFKKMVLRDFARAFDKLEPFVVQDLRLNTA